MNEFSRFEAATKAVLVATDIIHKKSLKKPQIMMSSTKVEKKKSDVVAKMAAPLSTMKFWKPGKYE